MDLNLSYLGPSGDLIKSAETGKNLNANKMKNGHYSYISVW